MKLILYNFKCYYGTHEFEIQSEGLTLICGTSGTGKTTLFEAICFVISGSDTTKKYLSYGESTCSVTFIDDDIKIVRKIKPNIVQYYDKNIMYDNDDAQARITAYFGPCFDYINYVPQHPHKTFLFASSTEKLTILENLLFENTELSPSALRRKCMDALKQIGSEYDMTRGKISMIKSQMSTYTDSFKERIITSTTLTNETEIQQRVLFLFNHQRIYNVYIQKITSLDREIQSAEIEISKLSTVKYENERAFKYDLETLRRHHSAITVLEPIQWKNYRQYTIDECLETIQEYESDLNSLQKYQTLQKTIDSLGFDVRQLIEIEKKLNEIESTAEAVYTCPVCATDVAVINQELQPTTKDIIIISAADKKSKLQAIKTQYANILYKQAKHNELKEQISSINIPEESLDVIQSQHQKWKIYAERARKIAKYAPMICDEELSANDTLHYIKTQTTISESKIRTSILQENIKRARKHLELLKLAASAQNLTNMSEELTMLEQQMSNHQLRTQMAEERKRYENLSSQLSELTTLLDCLDKRRLAILSLKEICAQAQMQCIEKTVKEIEYLTNIYCDEVFITNPVTVSISLYKDSKIMGVKPHLDIDIYYKNMKGSYNTLLSGGEQTRLNICFMLALSKYFSSRIFLLDESTAFLDSGLEEHVFNMLKTHKTRKIIVIVHNSVQGIFDQVIRMNNTLE